MERNLLLNEIRNLRAHELSEFELPNKTSGYEEAIGNGFYFQFNNANILYKQGKYKLYNAGGRTCNITCIAMIAEAFGLKKEDTKPEIDKSTLMKIAAHFKVKLKNKPLYDLRFPDFIQILAIYLKLEYKNASDFDKNNIERARFNAAEYITHWNFMDIIMESFNNLQLQDASMFNAKINSGLKNIGQQTSSKKMPVDAEKADSVISLSTYKEKVINSVKSVINNGTKMIVHQYNHFTVLKSVSSDGVYINNPGRRNGGNLFVPWNTARANGMFSGYMLIKNSAVSGVNNSPTDQVMIEPRPISPTPAAPNKGNNLQEAIRLNRIYAKSLGWDVYIDKINDLLLPFSGFSNVSLDEENFARALSYWQSRNRLTADSILGKQTWEIMKKKLLIPSTSIPVTTGANPLQTGAYLKTLNKTQWDRVLYIISKMNINGITNPYAKAALLAIVSKENEFTLKPEEGYAHTSNERIWKIFGHSRLGYSEEALNNLKADPEKFFNAVYGGRGLNAKDEGYKYRGRGFNQITFKERYKRVGNMIGVDLVSYPEKLNDLAVATDAILADFKDRFKHAEKNWLQHYNTDGINGFKNLNDAVTAFYHANAGRAKSYQEIERDPGGGKAKALKRAPEFLELIAKNP
jgi:predicted chitinase